MLNLCSEIGLDISGPVDLIAKRVIVHASQEWDAELLAACILAKQSVTATYEVSSKAESVIYETR